MKNKIFVSVFSVFLAALALSNLFAPKKDFSDNENRMLAVFPSFSAENLKNGRFTSGIATYLSDHFIGRDLWVSLKALSEEALGKRDNNGVFKAVDGTLIDGFTEADTLNFEKNLQAVSEFEQFTKSAFGIKTKTMIVPTRTQIQAYKLPRFAVTADGTALLDTAASTLSGFIDVSAVLTKHRAEYIYFHTDHHWTPLGAFYAYEAYQNAVGAPIKDFEDWNFQLVTDEFFGTTYSRYGKFFGQKADKIGAPSEARLKVTSVSTQKTQTNSIYCPEKLQEKDKYLYFLGGNEPIVTVTTDVDTDKNLLLIKDSYANAFLPFLTEDYKTIILIDMRYYQGVVPDLIKEEHITDILILYNLKSFSEDQYIPFINFTE